MSILHAAKTQLQILTALPRLDAVDPAERLRAAETLQRVGPAALPYLRYAVRPARTHRTRCAAAVALHGLNDPAGLKVLREILMALPPQPPEQLAEIEADLQAAFIAIGAPDAVTALIDLFPHLDERQTHIAACACAIFGTLRDPRALTVLSARALAFPNLFEQTVPAFGEMAVIHLERMIHDSNPARRILAIQALSHIPTAHSFAVLRTSLRDEDPAVRRQAPNALRNISPPAAAQAIEDALRAGFSTSAAVEVLAQVKGRANLIFFELVRRWEPDGQKNSGDTPDAVLAALPLLNALPISPADLTPPLCALLQREPDLAIAAGAARVLGVRGPTTPTSDQMAREALRTRLSSAQTPLRGAVATTLNVLGDPIGVQLQQRLQECWPQEGLLPKLQALLRGGPEAGQIATQTMQQVTQWFTRLSRETLDRLNANPVESVPAKYDASLPGLLSDLLHNALDALDESDDAAETGEMLTLCVATLRALARIGAPDALVAQQELTRALHLVKISSIPEPMGAAASRQALLREVAEIVRSSAASLLQECLGAESLPLFVEALSAPQSQVRRTAIAALGRLGDPRALAYLNPIAADASHADHSIAHEAILAIRRINPEMMTLLRASGAKERSPESLLRPASGNNDPISADLLLRPAAQDEQPQQQTITDSTLQPQGAQTEP